MTLVVPLLLLRVLERDAVGIVIKIAAGGCAETSAGGWSAEKCIVFLKKTGR